MSAIQIKITEEVPDLIPVTDLGEELVHVPLVIYVGGERRTIGEARVIGNCVESYITPADGNDLASMVQSGVIRDISVAFNAPPAVPVDIDGNIRWFKTY